VRESASGDVLIVTSESVAGKKTVQTLGMVRGSTVRARHLGQDILAFLKNIIGGEVTTYSELLQSSREEALERMAAEARALGANGVVGVRFATAHVMSGAAEILAYGTAVVLEDVEER
jgi:uncharacterized protein YbjQ (UPF0145 family)